MFSRSFCLKLLVFFCLSILCSFVSCTEGNKPCQSRQDCEDGQVCHPTKGCIELVSKKEEEVIYPDAHVTFPKPEKFDPCASAPCKVGEKSCLEAAIRICEKGVDGCGKWSSPINCKQGSECHEGVCKEFCKDNFDCPAKHICKDKFCSECKDECTLGRKSCEGARVKGCSTQNGCAIWEKFDCPTAEVCSEGKCIVACQKNSDCDSGKECNSIGLCVPCKSSCSAGEQKCDGRKILTCKAANGCNVWETSKTCAANQKCLRNLCVHACRDYNDCTFRQECVKEVCTSCRNLCTKGQTRCSGADLEVCKEVHGCPVWIKQTCGPGSQCLNGACTTTCKNTGDCPSQYQCASGLCQTCSSSCKQGESKCVVDKFMECQDNNGCLLWKVTPCGSGKACFEGICSKSCKSDGDCGGKETCAQGICRVCEKCTENDTKCDGNGINYTCKSDRGCHSWVKTPCSSTEICSQNKCVKKCFSDSDCKSGFLCSNSLCVACSQQCSSGEMRCAGNKAQRCIGNNGCYAWSIVKTCSSGEICSKGLCGKSCSSDSQCTKPSICKSGICSADYTNLSIFLKHGSLGTSVRDMRAISPNGDYLATGYATKILEIWNASTGASLNKLKVNGHTDFTTCATFSADSKQLVSGSRDTNIKLWDIGGAKLIRTFTGHSAWIVAVAMSPNKKYIASADFDGNVRIWDVQSGKSLFSLKHTTGETNLAFSPDGTKLAVSVGSTIWFWNVATGKKIATHQGCSTLSLAFHPDGRSYVYGCNDNSVQIADVSTGKILKKLTKHLAWVTAVTVSPDGNYLATGSKDKTIMIWDYHSGTHWKTLKGHTSDVQLLRFGTGNNKFLSPGRDRQLILWE